MAVYLRRKRRIMKKTKLETDLFYYGNYLELIGSFSLSKQLTLKDLGNTDEDKAVIQKCYRDMKRIKFKGNVIDYLCSISTDYIINTWMSNWGNKEFYANAKDYFKKIKGISNKKDFAEFGPVYMLMFLLKCHENQTHSKNMLRLFNKNPQIFLENENNRAFHIIVMDIARTTLYFFNLMMMLNSYEFLREKMEDPTPEKDEDLWNHMIHIAVETLVIRTHGWGNKVQVHEPKEYIKFKLLDQN